MSENSVVPEDSEVAAEDYVEWDDDWDPGILPSVGVVPDEVEQEWQEFRRRAVDTHFDKETLLEGVEKFYSTQQVAQFLGRSNQWVYERLRGNKLTYTNGIPIQPQKVGKMGRRRFTLPIIREMAKSSYRQGNHTEEELEVVMEKILLAEFGPHVFADPQEKDPVQ